MEFGLKGTSRVCCGCHRNVGIVEFGLKCAENPSYSFQGIMLAIFQIHRKNTMPLDTLHWARHNNNNQTVNDGVAHSKNPRKCVYHVTFDLDLENILDAGLPGDHRVQVWSRSSHLPGRRSDFRASTKVPVSRDL